MVTKRNDTVKESSEKIAKFYRYILGLIEGIKNRTIRPDRDLRNLITSGVDYMQFEEIKYTMATDGGTSPYYEPLLKTADELIKIIDSELGG